MRNTTLRDYRGLVRRYFRMEYSDIPLSQVLLQLPDCYREKAQKGIWLCHRLDRSPADTAAFMMRLFRPRLKSLIVGQEPGR